MDLFFYSDESGVFDQAHETYFVFAGIVLTSGQSISDLQHKYASVEKIARQIDNLSPVQEAKACCLSNKAKMKIFRSLNGVEKFCVVIKLSELLERIFENKKSKQRYMDFAYKLGVKEKLRSMIQQGKINPSEVKTIHFFMDEHTTATNGRYELREGLEQELKYGTFNHTYERFFPPLFPDLKCVNVKFRDSEQCQLVRAADIIANRIYYLANQEKLFENVSNNLFVKLLPRSYQSSCTIKFFTNLPS